MLYKTTVSFDMFVEADDEEGARDVIQVDAENELSNLLSSGCFVPEVEEVTDITQVGPEWRSAIPWGSYNDESVESKLNKGKGGDKR